LQGFDRYLLDVPPKFKCIMRSVTSGILLVAVEWHGGKVHLPEASSVAHYSQNIYIIYALKFVLKGLQCFFTGGMWKVFKPKVSSSVRRQQAFTCVPYLLPEACTAEISQSREE
jgi:hypothetical protein